MSRRTPLAVADRPASCAASAHGARDAQVRASAASCAASRSARRAQPPRRPRAAQPRCAPAAAATCSSPPRAPAAAATGRARPYLAFPDFRLSPGAVGRAADPGERRVLLRELDARRVAAFYPSPAGATESLLPLDTWDDVVAANPELATLVPDVEAFLVRVRRAGERRRVLSSCRSTPATSSSASCARLWRGFDGGARRTTRSRRSSPTCSPGPTGRRRSELMSSLEFEVRRAPCRAVRRGADAAAPAARSPRPTARAVHAVALRCQIRIEPQRRRYEPAEEAPRSRAVRRHAAVGRLAAAVPVDARRRPPSRLHRRRPRSTCRHRAPTTSRWPRPSTSTRLDDGEIPLVLLFSGTVFSPGDDGFRSSRSPGTRRRVPAAGRGLARRDGPLLPRTAAGARQPRRPSTRCSASRPSARSPTWDEAVERLLKEAGEEGVTTVSRSRSRAPAPSPTPCSTRATCCTRTGRRRRRTRSAGSSACSSRRAVAEADGSERWRDPHRGASSTPERAAGSRAGPRASRCSAARSRRATPAAGFVPVESARGRRRRGGCRGTRRSSTRSTSPPCPCCRCRRARRTQDPSVDASAASDAEPSCCRRRR